MRLLQCLCVCAALSASLTSSAPAASVTIHRHRRQPQEQQYDQGELRKHRYHIEGDKDALDAALAAVRGRVDVRSVQLVAGGGDSAPVVRASVFGSEADVAAIVQHEQQQERRRRHGKSSVHASQLQVTKAAVDEAAVIENDRKEVKACLDATDGYLELVAGRQLAAYTDSAFFDCFRPAEQVFAFLDLLAEQNAGVVTKLPNVSVTFEGRPIPAYRISSPSTGGEATPKRALYTQSLIHAREWQAGSSTFFAMAALVDDLLAGSADAQWILERFDWYFVPVVNIDGYIYTWEVDRMWRTNRDMVDGSGHTIPGVDLNRNFPPEEHFNEDPDDVDSETHPGDFPLSEPSTAGLFDFILSIDGLAGIVDMHTFGALVLRPFSYQKDPPPEPFGSMMVALGYGVRDALSTDPSIQYTSEPGGYLYEAFGCFDDGMFTTYNFTVPAITIEVEGDDFMVPQATIRSVGDNIYSGLSRFAEEAYAYAARVAELQASS
jgi:hypothetical protein